MSGLNPIPDPGVCASGRRASRASDVDRAPRRLERRDGAHMSNADASRGDADADTYVRPLVCVFGSINIDRVFRCASALPRAGETVGDATYEKSPGGKGANQACAAARCGARVAFVGCVGAEDDFSLAALREAGVDTELVRKVENGATGTACVLVDASGENCIAVAPGVNTQVNADDVPRCDVLSLQCEVPARANKRAIERARALNPNVRVMLNYAPASSIDWGLILSASTVCVNETELAVLREEYDRRGGKVYLKNVGVKDSDCFLDTLVVTRGKKPAQETRVPADEATSGSSRLEWLLKPQFRDHDEFFEKRVNIRTKARDGFVDRETGIVDTVGAGDAFVGAYCASWARGDFPEMRLKMATAAGTLACLEPGARPKSVVNARKRARDVTCEMDVGSPAN